MSKLPVGTGKLYGLALADTGDVNTLAGISSVSPAAPELSRGSTSHALGLTGAPPNESGPAAVRAPTALRPRVVLII